MTFRVMVEVRMTRLDDDGEGVPDPAVGSPEYEAAHQCARLAVWSAVRHAEIDGVLGPGDVSIEVLNAIAVA